MYHNVVVQFVILEPKLFHDFSKNDTRRSTTHSGYIRSLLDARIANKKRDFSQKKKRKKNILIQIQGSTENWIMLRLSQNPIKCHSNLFFFFFRFAVFYLPGALNPFESGRKNVTKTKKKELEKSATTECRYMDSVDIKSTPVAIDTAHALSQSNFKL